MEKILLLVFILILSVNSSNAQLLHRNASRNVEKGLFGKSLGKKKKVKVKEPRTVLKAKKKQEANARKLKKNYEQAIKSSQKRAYDIQTPEVQERMKQNQDNIIIRDKTKKKRVKSSSKKAGKKYKGI